MNSLVELFWLEGNGGAVGNEGFHHFYLADAASTRTFSRKVVSAIALNIAAALDEQRGGSDELFLVVAAKNCPEIVLVLLALGCPLLDKDEIRCRGVALVDPEGTSAHVAARLSTILSAAGQDLQDRSKSVLFFTTPDSVKKVQTAAQQCAVEMSPSKKAEVTPTVFAFGGTEEEGARSFESLLHLDFPPSPEDAEVRTQNRGANLDRAPKVYLIDESRGGIVVCAKPVGNLDVEGDGTCERTMCRRERDLRHLETHVSSCAIFALFFSSHTPAHFSSRSSGSTGVLTSDEMILATLPMTSLEGFAGALRPWLLSGEGTAAASFATFCRCEDPMEISAVCMAIGATALPLITGSVLTRAIEFTNAGEIVVGLDLDAIRENFVQVSPKPKRSGGCGAATSTAAAAAATTDSATDTASKTKNGLAPMTASKTPRGPEATLSLYFDLEGEYPFTAPEYRAAASKLRIAVADVIKKASLTLASSTMDKVSLSSSSRLEFVIQGSVGRAASVLAKCCSLGDNFVRALRGSTHAELNVQVGMTIAYVQHTSLKASEAKEEECKHKADSQDGGDGGGEGTGWLGWIGLGGVADRGVGGGSETGGGDGGAAGSGEGGGGDNSDKSTATTTAKSAVQSSEEKNAKTDAPTTAETIMTIAEVKKSYGQGIKLFSGKEIERAANSFAQTARAAAATAAAGGANADVALAIRCRALGNLGNCREKLGEIEAAVRAWSDCLTLLVGPKKRSRVYLSVALALAKEGKVAES